MVATIQDVEVRFEIFAARSAPHDECSVPVFGLSRRLPIGAALQL